MAAITTRLPECTIEYDTKKGRTTKHFKDANEAKGQYAKLERSGKNPKIIGEATPATEHAPKARKKKADAAPAPATEATAPATQPTPAPAAPTTPKVPGVAINARTRYFFAAKIIKAHGHAAGITEAMVEELDAAYGKSNKVESEIALRNAWHTIRSWNE